MPFEVCTLGPPKTKIPWLVGNNYVLYIDRIFNFNNSLPNKRHIPRLPAASCMHTAYYCNSINTIPTFLKLLSTMSSLNPYQPMLDELRATFEVSSLEEILLSKGTLTMVISNGLIFDHCEKKYCLCCNNLFPISHISYGILVYAMCSLFIC